MDLEYEPLSHCILYIRPWYNLAISYFSGLSLEFLYQSTGINNYLSTKIQIINHIKCIHLYSNSFNLLFEPSVK